MLVEEFSETPGGDIFPSPTPKRPENDDDASMLERFFSARARLLDRFSEITPLILPRLSLDAQRHTHRGVSRCDRASKTKRR